MWRAEWDELNDQILGVLYTATLSPPQATLLELSDTWRGMYCNPPKCRQPFTLIHVVYIFVIVFFTNFSKPLLISFCHLDVHIYCFSAFFSWINPWCSRQSTNVPLCTKFTTPSTFACSLNSIRSCYINLPSPDNRKRLFSSPKHPDRLQPNQSPTQWWARGHLPGGTAAEARSSSLTSI